MLLTGRNLGKSFGPRQLFTGITLGLAAGERVGLIGANGSGKSTLLRLFAGLDQPDEGEIVAKRSLRVGYVPQEEVFPPGTSCLKIVKSAVSTLHDDHDRDMTARLLLEKAEFADVDAVAGQLSGGWKKRLSVVRQLAAEPELLLLDEPTNHLDVEGIIWLEDLIDAGNFATLTVSHDRRFLEEVATRVIELGKQYPDGFLSIDGTYSDFVEKRALFLEAQAGRETAVASQVRREIAWLRRGAKARTTKSKGRIERAGAMMADLAALKSRNAQREAVTVDFAASNRQTRKLVDAKHVSKTLGDRELFDDVSFVLAPGACLGLLGPNGSGKSTLLKLIVGELDPDAGTIARAGQLRVAYFDQHRAVVDDTIPLRKALAPDGDAVTFNGERQHVTGWARRFHFRTEQLDLPVSQLSGGERARVLIAQLMLQPADVLILDEPTNDLDMETLDVLESSLETFAGATVLVTHDRYLLDRLATDILSLDGRGGSKMFAELSQWEAAFEANKREAAAAKRVADKPITPPVAVKPVAKKKLSWAEQKEFDGMEAAILAAETEVELRQAVVADPAVLVDHVKSRDAYARLGAAQAEVDRLYARWSEIEAKVS